MNLPNILPIYLLCLQASLFAQNSINTDTDAYFPGCGNNGESLTQRKLCSDQALFAYLYQQVNIPQAKMNAPKVRRLYVRFTVNPDGTVSDIFIANKSESIELGEAVMNAVAAMNALPQRWTAATKNGIPIAAKINVPLRFSF